MFSIKGIGIKIFALIMAVIAMGVGVWLTFFHSSGFEKAQATIVSMEETLSTDADEKEYRATVEYVVNGTTYTGTLDFSSPSHAVGKTVKVLYDPNNPSVVHSDDIMGLYLIGAGAVILVLIALTEIRKRTALKSVKEKQSATGETVYPASAPGPERTLYFLTDLGTTKVGHRLEDAKRNPLFEAKMTKYTLTAPFEFDFIDHTRGETTPHLVGHEESYEWENSLLFDNHYTFTFDGEDIWKHLKRNGIQVESSLTGLGRTEYKILRDGRRIAVAVSGSQHIHEEDEGGKSKLATLVPVQGFYRVVTTETDLRLLFVTLMAFARTSASDDRGGNFKTILGTVTKKPDKTI